MNTQRGQENVPDHIAAMSQWSRVPDDNDLNQPQMSMPPTSQPVPGSRSGLLSNAGLSPNWQSQQPRPALSLTEQDTLEQVAVDGPLKRPANYTQQPPIQAFVNGPVSPGQSGVTPFSSAQMQGAMPQAMNAPAMAPMSPMAPVQRPVTRPLTQPLAHPGYGPQTNAPVMSMPGMVPMMAQSPLQTRPSAPLQPMTYPGGPPPFIQPLQPPQPPDNGRGKHQKKKRRFPIWARVLVSILLFLMLAAGGAFGYYQANFSKSVGDITNQQVARIKGEDNPNAGRTGDILSGPRINILLLGSDTDQKFGVSTNGSTVYLAQTDIVVTIDPATKTVGMLSIPRDFYINIPGVGLGKLDEAFAHGYGMGQGGFAGAVALSRLTIEQDFGIPINYYAWVGLDGFVKVINTVNGVDVDVLHPITDDSYPNDVGNTTGDKFAYMRLYIPPGPQHLSGAEALNYVRSRHADLVGDFGRSARQQQVLSALKIKLNNPDIIGKLPALANDLDGFVKTDMQLTDVFKLMNFARSLDPNKIQKVTLGPPYSSNGKSLNGLQDVVNPNCNLVTPVIAQMFALGDKARCNVQANTGSSTLASIQPVTPSASMDGPWQTTSQLASASAMSLFSGSDNMLGYHSLIDLLCMVVFESPNAAQI